MEPSNPSPLVIPVSSITLGERVSRQFGGYKNLEQLAESIRDNGLINPITLAPGESGGYQVVAGGRRYRAVTEILGATELHHGVTCSPTTFGYLLKSDLTSDALSDILTEIAENLDRADVDWRDELELIVTAWRMAKYKADANCEPILMRNFGSMLGVSYTHLQAANAIYDDFNKSPANYAQCTSIRQAYAQMVKQASIEVTKIQAEVAFRSSPIAGESNSAQAGPTEKQDSSAPSIVTIPLTTAFLNRSGITYMEESPESFDHIVTDPDYAVDIERLTASVSNAATGVIQSSVSDSLSDLRRLIPAAYSALRPGGFFVFWYDLDHHEKLQAMCTAAGFAVQRWPLTWHKVDYRSNAAPTYNFCKNQEWAMVCRKGNATLLSAQTTSVLVGPTGTVTKDLGHPFAKPFWLWRSIYKAIATPGQSVFDPCVGSGSAAIAAAQYQLRPSGCELNPDHYPRLLLNLQTAYQQLMPDATLKFI